MRKASDQQIDDLVAAYNDNTEVRYSFGFRGNKPLFQQIACFSATTLRSSMTIEHISGAAIAASMGGAMRI